MSAGEALAGQPNTLTESRGARQKEADLIGSLSQAVGIWSTGYCGRFQMTVHGESRPLNPVALDEVLEIAHEALANSFRHSNASLIEVEVLFGRKALSIFIRDDGVGIRPEICAVARRRYSGLIEMRERAAKISASIEFWSHPGAGTEVLIRIPGWRIYRGGTGNRCWWLRYHAAAIEHPMSAEGGR